MTFVKSDYLIESIFLADDGKYPNSNLPVMLYRHALELPLLFGGPSVRSLFDGHGWFNSWSSGIFQYHHSHSNTFEVLGIISGSTSVLLGGENGKEVFIGKGD